MRKYRITLRDGTDTRFHLIATADSFDACMEKVWNTLFEVRPEYPSCQGPWVLQSCYLVGEGEKLTPGCEVISVYPQKGAQ